MRLAKKILHYVQNDSLLRQDVQNDSLMSSEADKA